MKNNSLYTNGDKLMTFIREVIKNTGVPTLHYEFKCNGKLVLITKTAFDREGWEEVG